jgi:murein DD-endopeptidase MepM/ murein hydrolase activator NlpD
MSLGAVFFFIFVTFVDSPEEKQLGQEKSHMQAQYKVLQRQFGEMQEVVSDLQERDDNLYRVVFQADPIPFSVRRAAATNDDYYEQLLDMTNSEVVVSTTKKLNELKKELYIQSKSYDELVLMAKNKENMLQNLPAIQPVLNKNLKQMASGYGWRIDPVYHTRRFHAGMDFAAPIGANIYATGNGQVISAGWQQGYGNCVQINHGYGYVTLYGHMSAFKIRAGQKVKRGDVIGLVGSTGKSTGPHLHYEVHFKGEIMNPQNYYFLDLSPADYDRMVQMSNNSGQMFD